MESDTESEYDYTIKLLVLGDTNVGKTKFIIRFSENKFQEEYMATIGIDLKFSTIEIKGKKIRVQMWDTAGQEKYRSITKNLFLKVQGILALYDITNDITFENLKIWIRTIKEECNSSIPIIIVGNKTDLEDQHKVNKNDAILYAKNEKVEYIETSSKTGENILKAITLISEQILESNEFANEFSFTLDSSSIYNKKKKCC